MGRIGFLAVPRPRVIARALFASLLAVLALAGAGGAVSTGKIQGRVVATDNGEPVGFADVMLIPADSTMRRIGALTNADGTFLLEAAPGSYTLRIRALSYATREIPGVEVRENQLLPLNAALSPEAILQKEVVIEAKALQNTEAAMLAARRKAAAVGDAVSAEQVRRAPDKDAAEVLRRVTGLSVSDGKYVFVRGLGERYSSTEVDGVRIASPEQNKRVVPLDLLPANLLENIVVQKTYTADRPGEFGGGDVQVRTRDFPGHRVWSLNFGQGENDGTTGKERRAFPGGRTDFFGFASGSRGMPDVVNGVKVPALNPRLPSSYTTAAAMGQAFGSNWGPRGAQTSPNANYAATYGDEFKLFGHAVGLINSWTFSRSYRQQNETQRFYEGGADAIKYDYAVNRSTASLQLGGISGLSLRLSPRHTLHARGLYSKSADDEVRVYEGTDFQSTEALTGTPLVKRNTRLLYTERSVRSGALEGKHEFGWLGNVDLSWKLNRSVATRLQPNRREYNYDRHFYVPDATSEPHWVFASNATAEFGDLKDDGWGTTVSSSVPYALGRLGKGRLTAGYDRQSKHRDNFYRRFGITANDSLSRTELPVDTIFSAGGFNGSNGRYSSKTGYAEDITTNDPVVGLDNYRANQRIEAGFVSADVPLGRRLRATLGARVEHGFQDVQSFALFAPSKVLVRGVLDDIDWLPSMNLTWSGTESFNLRAAASRTISRPDLSELSSSPSLEYVGGMLVKGNPNLQRARIDNYDLRAELFPGPGEVLAAGFFYKKLVQPIEQLIQPGTPHVLQPVNSDGGHNYGFEVEARAGLGRLVPALRDFALNSNASIIRSEIRLHSTSVLGSLAHPLQGQANYLMNGALSYSPAGGRFDASLLAAVTGRRLVALATLPLPDVYQQPLTTLDATLNLTARAGMRLKLAAKNLLDARARQVQAGNEVSGYRPGRGYSIAFSYGQ